MRILSDLHLGHRVSRIERVETLRPLIAGAGTVVFNGDTWQELAKELRGKSRDMLGDLQELCREEGCDTVFLPGNHDPGWPGEGWLELAGGRLVITHGDTLLRDGSPWKREILTGAKKINEIWSRHPAAESDADARHRVAREIAIELPSLKHSKGRNIVQRAWDAVTPPQRGLVMIKAWTGQAKTGDGFCERYFPQAEFLLIGHFHWGGTWETNGRRIINTGSFLNPGRAYWAEISGGCLKWGRVDEGKEAKKGDVLREWKITD